jgi:hypothetical protein
LHAGYPLLCATPALTVALLGVAHGLAAAPRDPWRPQRPPDAVLLSFGALILGIGAAIVGVAGLLATGVSERLVGFDDPFGAVDDVLARTRDVWRLVPLLLPGAGLAAALGLPGLLRRRWGGPDLQEGADVLAVFVCILAVGGTGVWSLSRREILTRLAGDHAARVLAASWGYDVPHVQPVPPRVLVADPKAPRWLILRDRGGVDVAPFLDGLDSVGASIRLKDGLMLPPSLTMLDTYLAISDSQAGAISLVGCATVPPDVLADIHEDRLLATGRCGAVPLLLRVTGALEDPRVLIALKDGEVDDGGDIVKIAEIRDIADRDVIVRAQGDALVSDLVATITAVRTAHRIYLGWGVDVDGEDIPVGVNPGLRIRAREQASGG